MTDSGTAPDDYGKAYFESYVGGDYHNEAVNWTQFFGGVADKLVNLFGPERVLDAGCAKGLLVESFVDRHIDAYGIDISAHAIAESSETVRDRLAVGSLTASIEDRFDLITCIEVLEHMAPMEAEIAIDNLTAATDRVIFSSTPRNFDDPTHINVRQPAEWAARFSERGFFRRIDVDLSFISPWAVAFERRAMLPRDIVFAYETLQWPLQDEASEKRQALLEKERLLDLASEKAKRFDELSAECEHRLALIGELSAEGERKATVIGELSAVGEERLALIGELSAVGEERLALIGELSADGEGKAALIDELSTEIGRHSTALAEVTENRDAISAERDSLRSELDSLRQRIDRLPGWMKRWGGGILQSDE